LEGNSRREKMISLKEKGGERERKKRDGRDGRKHPPK